MPTAEAVARYFLRLAALPEEGSPVTHLQLQKLMYYVQGWSLASTQGPLFEGRIEAWAHGPVVIELFPVFADYGSNPIAAHEAADSEGLSRRDRALIEGVWEDYGRYSAWHLREMTHREAPWRDARASVPAGAASRAPITHESLRAFFTGLRNTRLKRMGIDPESLEVSMREVRQGRVIPFEQLRAEVLAEAAARARPELRRTPPGPETA